MKQIRILFDNEQDLANAQQVALQSRVDFQVQPKPQIVDPFTAVLIGGAALLIGKFVVDLMDKIKGGVLIDLRPDAKALLTRTKEIPYGWVTVIAPDSTVKIEVRDAPKDASERLLSQIIGGALKTAKEVVTAAVKELGKDKVSES
jgi:hypothetical protein